MNNKILDAFSAVSDAEYQVREAMEQLEKARDSYKDAKVKECVKNILEIFEEDRKITERDLMIFIGTLAIDVKQIYFK